MVLLKQPGAVPLGAGGVGVTDELAPFAWHLKHSGAFWKLTKVWLGSVSEVLIQGLLGCGALVWQALQETPERPPE